MKDLNKNKMGDVLHYDRFGKRIQLGTKAAFTTGGRGDSNIYIGEAIKIEENKVVFQYSKWAHSSISRRTIDAGHQMTNYLLVLEE